VSAKGNAVPGPRLDHKQLTQSTMRRSQKREPGDQMIRNYNTVFLVLEVYPPNEQPIP